MAAGEGGLNEYWRRCYISTVTGMVDLRREGGREGVREGGREGVREGGREGVREEVSEGGRERRRECGGRERGRE